MVFHRAAVKIAFFINGFIYASWVARLPRIQEQFHADNGAIGLVILTMSMGAVATMPFTGWLILKQGSRRITFFAAAAYCVLAPLIPLMPNYATLLALYLLMGVSAGMLDVAMNAQALMVEQIYKRPIMTSFHALFSIGMTLGAWCGSLFTYLALELVTHFAVVSFASLLAVLWARQNLIRDRPDSSQPHDGPMFRLPSGAIISLGIITFCGMLGEGAMSDWSVNYMENIAFASESLAPIGLSAFAAAMTFGRIFGDRGRMAIGDRKMIVAGGIIAVAGLTIALALPTPYTAIAGFFLVGLGLSTIVPIAYSIAGNIPDIPSGVGIAMVTTVGYSGFFVGPAVIGFVADEFTLRIALCVVVALLVLMTVLGFRYKTKS